LETVLSKGYHTREIKENEKLKQSINGSFLTAEKKKKERESCACPGEVGADLMPETVRAGIESMAVNPVITKLDCSISG
jgi:hypothetical protein